MAYNNGGGGGGVDFELLLAEDFLLFLEICRDPNQVFKPNSDESCLAQKWLDKLCRYECADLDEQRLRNVYISYLCCCLIEGVLKGPFANQPFNGRLQRVDFNAKKKQPLSCPAMSKVKTYKECENSMPNRCGDICEQQLGSCCFSNGGSNNFNGVGGGGGGVSIGSGANRDVMRCAPEVRFSPDIQCESDGGMKRNTGNIFSEYMLSEIRSPSAYNTFGSHYGTSCDSLKAYDPSWQVKETIRQDVASLLEAIGAELRGNVGSGCDDYLENELVRYKNFIMNFSSIACVLDKLKSEAALRSFLLINLQNDLIKLISDNCL